MIRNTDYDCPNCDTITTDVWVDGEEAQIVLAECQLLGCGKTLCLACPKFICDGCSLLHCREHAIYLGGEMYCPVCMKEISETAAEIAAEAAEAA